MINKKFKQGPLVRRSIKLHASAKKTQDQYEKGQITKLVRQVILNNAEKKFSNSLDTFTAGVATVSFIGSSLMGAIRVGTGASGNRIGDKVRVNRISWSANIQCATSPNQQVRLILLRDVSHGTVTLTAGAVISVPNTQSTSLISGYSQEFNSQTNGPKGIHILSDKTFSASDIFAGITANSNGKLATTRRSFAVSYETDYTADTGSTTDIETNELVWLCIFDAFSGTSAATVYVNTQILYTDM